MTLTLTSLCLSKLKVPWGVFLQLLRNVFMSVDPFCLHLVHKNTRNTIHIHASGFRLFYWWTVGGGNAKTLNMQAKGGKERLLASVHRCIRKNWLCKCLRKEMHSAHLLGLRDTCNTFWWETLNINKSLFIFKKPQQGFQPINPSQHRVFTETKLL